MRSKIAEGLRPVLLMAAVMLICWVVIAYAQETSCAAAGYATYFKVTKVISGTVPVGALLNQKFWCPGLPECVTATGGAANCKEAGPKESNIKWCGCKKDDTEPVNTHIRKVTDPVTKAVSFNCMVVDAKKGTTSIKAVKETVILKNASYVDTKKGINVIGNEIRATCK